MYEIEKGIPVPKVLSHSQNYPFKDMEVGDSFLAPIEEARRINALFKRFCFNNLDHRFITESDTDAKTVRCWRIK